MIGRAPAGAVDVWSTSAVERSRALEYWRALISDTFVPLSAAPVEQVVMAYLGVQYPTRYDHDDAPL